MNKNTEKLVALVRAVEARNYDVTDEALGAQIDDILATEPAPKPAPADPWKALLAALRLVESVAEQQAYTDDSWRPEAERLRALATTKPADPLRERLLRGDDARRMGLEVCASRYRWLRDAGATFYVGETRHHVCEWAMDDAIDAAILLEAAGEHGDLPQTDRE